MAVDTGNPTLPMTSSASSFKRKKQDGPVGNYQRAAEDRKPIYWGDKVPGENWTRSLPSIQIPSDLYEAVVDMSMDVSFEYGGKITPLVREALDEFINKYGDASKLAISLHKQMSRFREIYADELIAHNLLENVAVVDTAMGRWVGAGDVEQVTTQIEKILMALRSLPSDWQQFAIDHIKELQSVKLGFALVLEAGDEREGRIAQTAHDILQS